MIRRVMKMKSWGFSNARRTESDRRATSRPSANGRRGLERVLAHARPTRPCWAVLRICTGLMLVYTHAVWGLALDDFFGPTSLAVAGPGASDRGRSVYVFVLVLGARPVDVAGVCRVDGESSFCSRWGCGRE